MVDLVRDVTAAREEARAATAKCDDLQREAARIKESAGRVESLKVAEVQAEAALLKQEVRSRESHLAAQQDQLRSEADRFRALSEQTEQLRRENDELRGRLQAAGDKCESTIAQSARRDELVKLLEADIGHKQQRLDQSERLVLTLQAQVGERDLLVQKWQTEAETRARSVAELEAQMRKLDAIRADLDTRGERSRMAFQEMCDAVGATDARTAATRLRELQTSEARLRQELQDTKQASDLRQYEVSTRAMAADQLRGDVTRLQEALRTKDGELAALREELVGRTRELRSLTVTHAGAEHTERSRADQLGRMQALLDQRDAALADRDRAAREQASRDQSALLEARNEGLRAHTEHARVVSGLQQRIGELEQQLRGDADYVDVCRRIGRLLCVDPTTSPAQHASGLVQAVERLCRDRDAEARFAREGSAGLGATGTLGSTGLGMSGAFSTGGHAHHHHQPGLPGAASEDYLKAQLLESEQRFVKAQVKLDTVLRDIARAMHIADTRDADTVVAEVAKLAKGKRTPAPPATPQSTPQRPGTARLSEKDKDRDVHAKLQTALDTIAQQDRWIASLRSRDGAPAQQELQTLRDEVARLRAQAAATDRGAVAELEARLQRHIDFRSALLRALQIPSVSATDEAVLRRVEQLLAEATRPAASTLTALAGPGTYGLGAGLAEKARPLTGFSAY